MGKARGTPSVMIAFGETEKQHTPVAVSFTLPCISPVTALADLQKFAQERVRDMPPLN